MIRLGSLLLVFGLAGCAFGSSNPDGQSVLRSAGQALASVHSVSADVKFGPGIAVQGLTLSSATAKIAVPASSDAIFKVRQGDFLVDVRVVTVGGAGYIQLPFSKFTQLTAAQSAELPNLAMLFDPTHGLPVVMASGSAARWEASEKMGGVDSDRVSAVYSPDQIGSVLASSAARPAASVKAVWWVGSSDHLVRRVVLTGPLLGPAKDVSVDITLHDFNAPVTIVAPAV
jgi:hypothetical protein